MTSSFITSDKMMEYGDPYSLYCSRIAGEITPQLSSTPEIPPTTGHLAFCTLHVNEMRRQP
jgi:hypothetical protein